MQVRTGVDIIEVDRIQEAIEKSGTIFLNKVYTQNEINYCEKTGKMKFQHYAARFAAKEAVFKAISTDIDNTDSFWKRIEVNNNKIGKPMVDISKLGLKNVESMDISISHIKNYAIASFIIVLN